MNFDRTLRQLRFLSQQGKYVYNTSDLHTLLHSDSLQAARSTISRLVQRGVLAHACRSVHVFREGITSDAKVLHDVAIILRRGTYCYISLESALAAHGLLDAAPDALSIVTTGTRGAYDTPWGRIEFNQTRRKPVEIVTRAPAANKGGLRLASADMALEDMKRLRRGTVSTRYPALEGA
jgi:hypothetical protein